jgi:ATP-binding cassette, subfamily B, multidrug efflux pump
VIVVEDGRIVGAGTHASLMAESPTYREFAESQSLDAKVGGPR